MQGNGFAVMHYAYIEDAKRVLGAEKVNETASNDFNVAYMLCLILVRHSHPTTVYQGHG